MAVVEFDAAEHIFEMSLPLVIVGGGACGLVSALAASEADIEMIVLERDKTPMGSTFMSSGFIPAADTRFQHAAGVSDSPELMASDIQNKNHHEADPDIVNVLAEKSGEVIEWLADAHQIPFQLVEGFLYPGHSQMRMHCTPRKTGQELMSTLLNATADAGIDILTSALVTDLFVDDKNNIRGVRFTQPDGSETLLGCDVLILASNGYGGNLELIERYLPQMKNALYYGHEGNQGDAVLWGESLGASLKDLTAFQGHGSLADPPQTLISWAVMMQGGVQININGQRFSNENGGYSEQAAKVLAQPTGYVYNVYDERIHQSLLDFEDYQNALSTNSVKIFDNLSDMASALKMDQQILEDTLTEMHQSAISKSPDHLGRQFVENQLISQPYYVIRVTGALFHTQGGLEISTEGRVKDNDGEPFPNLYAAGGAARGVSGSNDSGYLSGNGLLHAVVMGAIAGRSAAIQISE